MMHQKSSTSSNIHWNFWGKLQNFSRILNETLHFFFSIFDVDWSSNLPLSIFLFSSRFTDSKRYEAYFEKCFSLEEQRSGEICNACVLLVKRYIKLPAGSTRHWNHVVDARSGPGIKSLVKSKKQKENNTSNRDENDTPEKINKKHFYRSKKKPAVVRKRNPSIPVSGFLDMSRWQKYANLLEID